MAKLYAVTLELAVNVVADSEDEAIRIATRSAREEDADSFAVLAVQEGVAAAGWTKPCIPYADGGRQRSVGEWLRNSSESPNGSSPTGGKADG